MKLWILIAALIIVVGLIIVSRINAEKEVTAAVLTSAAIIAAAIFGNAITVQAAKKREIEEAYRLQKIDVYTEFTDIVVSSIAMTAINKSQNIDMKELQKRFVNFSKKLLLWGSPEVINAYSKFLRYGQDEDTIKAKSAQILICVDNVFKSMRNDLGLPSKTIKQGDLIKLFIKDPQRMDKMLRNDEI